MSGFLTRVLTALVAVVIFIFCLYVNEFIFASLICIISLLSFYEYLVLVNQKKPSNKFQILLGLVIFGIYYFIPFQHKTTINTTLIFICVLFLLSIILIIKKLNYLTISFRKHFFGYFYTIIPFTFFLQMAYVQNVFRPNIIMGVILLIWSNDTFAYLFGSLFGRTKLFESISPKKTWEGSIGAAVCTIGLSFLIPTFLSTHFTNVDWFILAVIAVIFGSYGDLIQSFIKRQNNTKDSGKILPGHGGLLDRFDALIYSVPFMVFYLTFIKQFITL